MQDVKGKARRVISAKKSARMAGKWGSFQSAVLRAVLLSAGVALTAAGCSLDVPDPAAPKVVPTTPGIATPTITPGYDAAAVAGKDMPFAAGDTLPAGVPVGISDGLAQAPGWKPGKQDVAGENQYIKADGCVVAAKVRTNQWPLTASGNDKTSTVELFTYLDSTILPDYLTLANLRWGGEPDKPAPNVEVLVLERGPTSGAKATSIMARMFGKTGSSVYISISCPDQGTLSAAKADVAQRVAVVPPSD
ncbi:hypothetical protein M1D88_14025 [Arthrobacter sp. R1-13]